MKSISILLSAMCLLLFSCNNSTNEKAKVETEIVSHEGHHHGDETQSIELNNGQKWKVDDNMLVHIRTMENDVNSFVKTEQKDYKLLSEKLQSNIDLLTSNCTMKGEAHDELHKWLLPYIDLVNEFSEAKNGSEASTLLDEIKTSFTTFNKYFE